MGGSWVGLVLVAAVTSLPELVTGVSAEICSVAICSTSPSLPWTTCFTVRVRCWPMSLPRTQCPRCPR